MNNSIELNQKVADALKAYDFISEETEVSSQYFIEIDRMDGEASPMAQLAEAFADFDLWNLYTGADALSGFSNGYLFTVREAQTN